jgi:hypothetical protein
MLNKAHFHVSKVEDSLQALSASWIQADGFEGWPEHREPAATVAGVHPALSRMEKGSFVDAVEDDGWVEDET